MTDDQLAQRVVKLEREVATLRRALETADKWRIKDMGSGGSAEALTRAGSRKLELHVAPIYNALRNGDAAASAE